MASNNHEKRIAQLERQVDALRKQIEQADQGKPWWERIAGSFEKDPIYAKAMKLGREYRESLRPRKSPRSKG
jgi:hypothetical protein